MGERSGMYCCARADGHPLDDGEWDIKDNHYSVFVQGEWAVMPDDTVNLGSNKFGKTIVWLVNQGEVETRSYHHLVPAYCVLCRDRRSDQAAQAR